jgi:hypothetical protein
MAEEDGVVMRERAQARPPGYRRRKQMKQRKIPMMVSGGEAVRKGRRMIESES